MISPVSDYTVLLDACVLLPISLTDLLLRLAEDPAVYSPRWSRDILNEVEQNLQKKIGLSREKARYRIACMESAFPEAMVTGYESLDRPDGKPRQRQACSGRRGTNQSRCNP